MATQSNTLAHTPTTNKDYTCWFKRSNLLVSEMQNVLKPISTPQQTTFIKSNQEITHQWYLSVADLPNIWETLAIDNIFLKKEFLACLEKYPPEGMQFLYWVFFENSAPVGFAYAQIQHFNIYKSATNLQQAAEGNLWERLKHKIKQIGAKSLNFNVLVLGNMMSTGEHGFYFTEAVAQKINAPQLVEAAITASLPHIKARKVDINLFKEFYAKSLPDATPLLQKNYHQIAVQPSMILDICPEWKAFDDYLQAVSSKYRVRAKRAFKKGADLVKKELSLAEIEHFNDTIFSLYLQTVSNANFNALFLHPQYFYGLKAFFKDDFKLTGYFLNDELIGFCTLLFNNEEIESHFLGLNNEYNYEYQVYLNMLFNMIDISIQHQAKRVIMARTALEIKSSVGAVAHDMSVFVKLKNPIYNAFIKRITASVEQAEEWTPRQPFK